MKKRKDNTSTANNLVAKHARTFNKAHVMVDRKKSTKKGYSKHKGRGYSLIEFIKSLIN